MKKAICITVCLLSLLLLCSCKPKEQNDMGNNDKNTLIFINGVKDADVWILPQTQENMKTSLWGTATLSDVRTGESRKAPLCEPGDGGLYIIRMIDTDGFFYSVSGVSLEAGMTLHIRSDDSNGVSLDVKDKNGKLQNTYKVFSAKL